VTGRDLLGRLLSRIQEEWAGLRRIAALVGWSRERGTPRRPGVVIRPGSDTRANGYASEPATDQPRRLR
jgi:hypothetical protein